jgi:hypothetical protein
MIIKTASDLVEGDKAWMPITDRYYGFDMELCTVSSARVGDSNGNISVDYRTGDMNYDVNQFFLPDIPFLVDAEV